MSAAEAPHPWLAAAHAGGEIDIYVYDMQELLPGATISFRSPAAALALAWNPWRPHVLITGASDQTVRGWNVGLPKYAHPDAPAPLLPAPEDSPEHAASAEDDETTPEAADSQVADEQASPSVKPYPATKDAEAAAASTPVASADTAAKQSTARDDGAASAASAEPAAMDMRSAQAALDMTAAAELRDMANSSQGAAGALPPEVSARHTGAVMEDSTAEPSAQPQDSQQPSDTAPAAAVQALLQQSAAPTPPEQQDTAEVMISRPVDLAEVAAIRRGKPAKSPMRAAASLSVGSLVGRLRREGDTDDMAVATGPLPTTSGSVSGEPVVDDATDAADTARKPGSSDNAVAQTEESLGVATAGQGSRRGKDITDAAEASTTAAPDGSAGSGVAAEAAPREGARPIHGVESMCPRRIPSCCPWQYSVLWSLPAGMSASPAITHLSRASERVVAYATVYVTQMRQARLLRPGSGPSGGSPPPALARSSPPHRSRRVPVSRCSLSANLLNLC